MKIITPTLRYPLFIFVVFLFAVILFATVGRNHNIAVKRSGKSPTFDTTLFPQIQSSPQNYPPYTPLLNLLKQWNPDNPTPSDKFRESLQHFNYSNSTERALAEVYRKAELPFKVYDVPVFNNISSKWTRKYLSRNFRNVKYHIEESKNNHFMYWTTAGRKVDHSYIPPTRIVSKYLDFDSWSNQAEKADELKLDSNSVHYYLMTGSQRKVGENHFVHQDLSVFRSMEANLFIPTPKHNKGIQCRFGMRGVIAECHYDSGRNSVAVLKGAKRYILSPPETCNYLDIIADKRHPSFRHSRINFSNLSQVKTNNFHNVQSVETIVRAGEVLYIPSFWFHYVVSLEYSIQCNSRSGLPEDRSGQRDIEKCTNMKLPD